MRKEVIYKQGSRVAEVILADTFFLRLRGLIGRTLAEGQGLLLSPCNQIHTFWMGYPIDTVYLDAAGRIVRIDENVLPNRTCRGERGAKRVLELPAFQAAAAGLAKGDQLEGIQ